jgi:uncharacterized protein with ATP-grasp and redox domains
LKATPYCVPCLIKRALYETALVGGNPDEAVMACLESLRDDYSPGTCSAVMATRMHRRVYDLLGVKDPYRDLKDRANRVALSLLPAAETFVRSSQDPLRAAVLCSIAGNVMDFGIEGSFEGPEALMGAFLDICREGLARDDLEAATGLLGKGSRVVYLLDNCGEVVLDAVLMGELASRGVRVTAVVKGEPILTDATREDVAYAGLDRVAEAVVDTGAFAVGLDMENIPPALAEAMDGADLLISKGMANYEALSERDVGPVLHLMRTKCRPVAESLGLPMDKSVAVLMDGPSPGPGRKRAQRSSQSSRQ